MAYLKTNWANNTTPAINAANLNKIEQGITDVSVQADYAEKNIGNWCFETAFSSTKYPRIQFDNVFTKVYFKLLQPTSGVVAVEIYASNDGWQSQTQLYFTYDKEFIAEIDPTGFSSIRVAITLTSSTSGTYRAIIHNMDNDNYSLSQEIVELKNFTKEINDSVNELRVPANKLTGTNYSGYYLGTPAYKGIKSIANTIFNIRAYSVLKDTTYYLYGKGVALNASLPLAAFGTEEVANENSYKVDILDGTTTPNDYVQSYTPSENGYIYVAWVEGKVELGLYNSEPVSDAFISKYGANEKKNISVQLFGDSITDVLYGDHTTWATFIDDNLSDYDVTVYNDAVAGSGIGHGKSTGTESHQTESYNYVHDLVTNGVTLKSNVDFIVILIGTNDWSSGKDIGNMTSTSVNTLYGALKGIIEYISEHSTAIPFICTIPQRYNSTDESRDTNAYGEPLNADNVTLAEYCEPYRKLSAFYGLPCIDLNTNLGWNRINIYSFSGDGLHPNAKGDKLLSALICDEIRKHIDKVM